MGIDPEARVLALDQNADGNGAWLITDSFNTGMRGKLSALIIILSWNEANNKWSYH